MWIVDSVLIFQALLGAFDNLWHHEWQARLPGQPGARRELTLHATREALYGALFVGLAWWAWHGWWAAVVGAVLLTEVGITLADFLEEDRTRRLPPLERAVHTVLTLSFGLFLCLMAQLLWSWWQQPTGLVSASRGWVSWWFTLMAVVVWLWSLRNALAVRKWADAPMPAGPAPAGWTDAVLVTGGTGFVGRALIRRLRSEGRRVIALTRDARQARGQSDAHVRWVESLDEIAPETRIAAIFHLAGARVLGLPWTAARRRELIQSRTRIAEDLQALVSRLERRPPVWVSASAVGYYGVPKAGVICDEGSPAMPGVFQSDLCAAAEHEARRAEGLGLRVVRVRLGVVLGRGDGAYPMQALAARLGLGACLGSGTQALPWVHVDDAVGLLHWAAFTGTPRGALNAVAPEICNQRYFAQTLAASWGRRVWLSVPAWPLRLLAGEMATLLLDGQAVQPRRALLAGYRFAHPTLRGALQDLAGHSQAGADRREPMAQARM